MFAIEGWKGEGDEGAGSLLGIGNRGCYAVVDSLILEL